MYGVLSDESATVTHPKFKVGQRLIVVRDGDGVQGSNHGASVGDVVEVLTASETGVCGKCGNGVVWWFNDDELAHAFLPGDKVRVTKHAGYFAAGDTCEVERQSDTVVFVKHGSYQRLGLPIDADALELVEAARPDEPWLLGEWGAVAEQPCIVARIVDGQPRPSNLPYVHPNVTSAMTEAERLAHNNPGQEFSVYQRVAGRVAEISYSMREVA
jgi:hypothetical protein